MSKWVVDIHGDIEGDYEIIEKYEEPKTGHWIEDLSEYDTDYPSYIQAVWKCSECKKKQVRKSSYCPNCGAKMESEV